MFTDPNGDELLLVAPAEARYAYALRFGKDPFVVTYSAAEIASGRTNGVGIVEFVQSFQNVNLLRRPFQGGEQACLGWHG